jgi:hypothetical protein
MSLAFLLTMIRACALTVYRERSAMRTRAVKQRTWLPVAVVIAGVGTLAAVVLWAPHGVRGWLGGVLAAAFTAYLTQDVPRWVASSQWWRRRRFGVPAPLAITVKIIDEDYVVFPKGDRVVEVPASGHGLRLVVEATGSRPVVLTALRPEVLSRHDRNGDLNRRAAAIPLRRFEVLLDAQPPCLRAVSVSNGGDGSDFPFRVTPDDPEVLELKVHTKAGDVCWVLYLDWVCDGRVGTTRIDLDGRPLRTMARHARPSVGSP